jgi:hypothetical protein
MPVITSKSLWPLAGYAALAAVAFARRGPQPRRLSPAGHESQSQKAIQPDETPAAAAPVPDSSWWGLTKSAAMQWVGHKDARLGAALSYYSVFSLGPLIVIAIAIAGVIFGQDAVRGEVTGSLKGLLGDTGAQAIDSMLAGASRPREGIVATIIASGL